MPVETKQSRLDVDAEPFTKREKAIKKLLQEYHILPARIEYYTRLSNGDGLLHQPNITMRPPDEDDPELLVKLAFNLDNHGRDLPLEVVEQHEKIVDVLKSRLNTNEITIATCSRVAAAIQTKIESEPDEEHIMLYAYTMLQEAAQGDERLELTETERLAILRDKEIRRARQKLRTYKERKHHLDYALRMMQQFFEYEYTLLYNRYVMDGPWYDVAEMIGLDPRTQRDTYNKHQRKAMEKFAQWVPSHLVG